MKRRNQDLDIPGVSGPSPLALDSYHPSGVQYMGAPGMPKACLLAVDTIVNSHNPPRKGSLVTYRTDVDDQNERHLFLFWDWNDVRLTVVHAGFRSGHGGEGVRSFSEALCMLIDREIPTNLIYVDAFDFSAIENRELTSNVIDRLRSTDDKPYKFWFYHPWIHENNSLQLQRKTFWSARHEPRLNFDFLDPEIVKRCRHLFDDDPEAAIKNAVKVLEERLRILLGKRYAYGDDLIREVADPDKGIIIDNTFPRPEREGIYYLLMGAMKSIRNPVSHRFVDGIDKQRNIETIYLIDFLLRHLPS